MPVAAVQDFRVGWGPCAVAWRLEDPALADALAGQWRPHLLPSGPVDLTVLAEPADLVCGSDARSTRPMRVTPLAGVDGFRIRFGNLLEVCWQPACSDVAWRYERTLCVHDAAGVFEQGACRFLSSWLASRGLALLHACAIVTDEAADLFIGPSGEGKSTVAASVSPARVVHDDTVICERRADGLWVAQAPWCAARWATQAGRAWPVGRLLLLRKDGGAECRRVPAVDALHQLWQPAQTGVPGLPVWPQQRLALLSALVERHAAYRLRYRLGVDDPWSLMAGAAQDG